MDATTRLKLEELRKEAFKRLETDKHRPTAKELETLINSVPLADRMRIDSSIFGQMAEDLHIYPIYDCLAMWLDPDAGLALYEPKLLLDIGQRLLQLNIGVIHP